MGFQLKNALSTQAKSVMFYSLARSALACLFKLALFLLMCGGVVYLISHPSWVRAFHAPMSEWSFLKWMAFVGIFLLAFLAFGLTGARIGEPERVSKIETSGLSNESENQQPSDLGSP